MALEAEGERLPVEQGQEQGEAEGVRVTLRVRVVLTVADLLREVQEDWEGDTVMVWVTEGDRVTVSATVEVMVAVRQRVTLRVCDGHPEAVGLKVAGDTESVADTVEESEPEGVPE